MNRRVLLAFGAVAVVAAVVILYLAINADDSKASSTTTDETVATNATTSTTASSQQPTTSPTGSTTTSSSTTTGDRPPPKEYYVDGKKVRDHRRGDHPPIAEQPPREEVRKLATPVTQEIGAKFQTVFKDCMKAVPKEAKGDKPRLTGSLIVEIKDHQLKVTETQLTLNNIAADAAATAKQCIEKNAVGLATGAADEADVERHAISLNLAIR